MKVLLVLLSILISVNYVESSVYSVALKLLKMKILKIIDQNVSEKDCSSDLKFLFNNSNVSKMWALQMLDASAKFYPSVLRGNIHLFGDFDQCLSISETDNGKILEGQYCTALLLLKDEFLNDLTSPFDATKLGKSFNLLEKLDKRDVGDLFSFARNKTVALGLCIPKSCSISSLQTLATVIEKLLKLPAQVLLLDDLCLTKNTSIEATQLDVLIYCFFVFVIMLVVGSTIYDLCLRCSGQNKNILVIFSAYTNLEKLLTSSSNDDNLSFLQGIKVLCSMWVILGHTFLLDAFIVKNPADFLIKWRYQISNAFIWNSFYAVESFFTISGLLASYIYLKQIEKISIDLLSFYLVRFIRLTPSMLAVLFINTSVLKLLTNGPYGRFAIKTVTQSCQHNWWQFLFYFITLPDYKKCYRHVWYVSIDSQLYLYAPLILFFIKKYPKRVLIGTTLAFLTGIIYSFVVTINKKLGCTAFDWSVDYMDELYTSKLYHLPSWLLGIVLGYLLHYHKMKIPNVLNVLLWIISFYTFIKLIVNKISLVENEYSVYQSALWNGLAQPTWSLALCYVIYSCGTKNGGFINNFLSHYIFRILGKLTYSIYLVHMPVLLIFFSSIKEAVYFSNLQGWSTFAGLYIIIVPCAILLYLGFEAPIIALKDFTVRKTVNKKAHAF